MPSFVLHCSSSNWYVKDFGISIASSLGLMGGSVPKPFYEPTQHPVAAIVRPWCSWHESSSRPEGPRRGFLGGGKSSWGWLLSRVPGSFLLCFRRGYSSIKSRKPAF